MSPLHSQDLPLFTDYKKKNVSKFRREDQMGSDQIVRFLMVLQAVMISPEQVNISKQFAIFAISFCLFLSITNIKIIYPFFLVKHGKPLTGMSVSVGVVEPGNGVLQLQ